ncbi:active breakpoint cluster region-related protein-like isoform X2 [Varroa destructor]|uniref:Active breakpoint cluster region-related protein n=1 Tax=Varroa destructor TaxID=109461 RepID=A0A7M7KLN2_VARDE|nr:active breakpoint cluster region-related protein-like isoform X2 [Varroa destructor]
MEFSDLQRSWADRFPQDKLSLIFEEDMKTLLTTHKARVAQLRKELAQEEFLVEYFERALNDERQRRRSVTSEEPASQSPLVLSRENSFKDDSQIGPEIPIAVHSSNPPINPVDPESYVTVIAVSSQDEGEIRPKKKPPAPPPKRVARWPPASTVNALGTTSPVTTPDEAESTLFAQVAQSSLSTFGKPKFGSQLSNQSTASSTSSFQLALSSFRQATTEPSTPSTPVTPTSADRAASTTCSRSLDHPSVVASASDLSSSQSKSNDSSLERNTNTTKSADSSLERSSLFSGSSPATSALQVERSASCRLERHASSASSHSQSSRLTAGDDTTEQRSNSSGNSKRSTLHLLKDTLKDTTMMNTTTSNNNSHHHNSERSVTTSNGGSPAAGLLDLDCNYAGHRKLDKTSTLSSNDSSFDGLDDAPIYDTVAADETDAEESTDGTYDSVRCGSRQEAPEQDYVEFGGYGRIPASLVTDSTEEDSDGEEPSARSREILQPIAKSCEDLRAPVASRCDGSELRPSRRPPPVPGKPTGGGIAPPVPQIPLRRGRSEERLDGDSGVYSSSMESYLSSKTSPQLHRPKKSKEKHESEIPEKQLRRSQGSNSSLVEDSPDKAKEVDGVNLFILQVRKIIESVIESETAYVDCLDVLHQYGKALGSATRTNQAVLSREDVDTIFFKIEQLLDVHRNFRDGLRRNLQNPTVSGAGGAIEIRRPTIGENFKFLASRLEVYNLFLQNYSKAIETVRRCSINNAKFDELSKNMKMKGQTTSLEDLLHKPVARIQKNALVIDDLLQATSFSHPDYNNLKTASKLTQHFLENLKTNSTLESMFPLQDRASRHVVRNVFMVQLEGHRKLRHLFLFNDVLVCAKCKTNGRTRYLEVKWFIPLNEVTLLDPEGEAEPIREQHPANVCQLRSRANSIRDQIRKLENKRGPVGCQGGVTTSRPMDKLRRKLSDLEAALMLHSPHLPFKIGHKNHKVFQFFVSSEFERQQWIEAIHALQQQMQGTASNQTSSHSASKASGQNPSGVNLPIPHTPPTIYELNTCIAAAGSKSTLGSRPTDDLLLGELHVHVVSLQGGETEPSATAVSATGSAVGLSQMTSIAAASVNTCQMHICLEVDSYGHFFRKGRTKTAPLTAGAEARFRQELIMDVDGSQTLRILLYEELPQGPPLLRGKATFELSKSWLTEHFQDRSISLQEYTLNLSIKYVPYQQCLRRNLDTKPVGTFGLKIEQVCKKEKSPVPFLINCCVREVEKRGINEVGIYRLSGSTSDVQRLRRVFENDPFEAEQLLREVDINAVAHLLKLYLRELPEALFTDQLYPDLFEALSQPEPEEKSARLLALFQRLPAINRNIVMHLIDHMVVINRHEEHNKMSINNLATVFGPTLIRPNAGTTGNHDKDLLTCGTVDVMAQASILHFFLKRKVSGLPLEEPIESAHM